MPPSSSPAVSNNNNNKDERPAKRKRIVESLQNVTDAREEKKSASGMEGGEIVGSAGGLTSPSSKRSSKKSKEQSRGKSEKQPTQTAAPAPQPPKAEGSNTETQPRADAITKKPTRAKTNDTGKVTGFFTPDEVQALENFKVEFCNSNGLPGETFNRMVQHSDRDKGSEFPCESSITSKQDFWKSIYETIPNRDRRSVYRFMRRHFQASTQKPHEWTHEQDEELVSLHERYGPKWAQIAKLLGRSDDDVVQRWKNKLEHRDTMRRGPWLEQEVRGLQEALTNTWESLKRTGRDVGKDIYEMDETFIAWGVVSDYLQNCRSRQQCADKWRKVRRKVMKERARGNPDAVYDPVKETQQPVKPPKVEKPSDHAPGRWKVQPKSQKYVNSDDEEGGEDKGEKVNGKEAADTNAFNAPESLKEAKKESSASSPQKPASKKKSQAVNGKPVESTTASFEKDAAHESTPSDNESESESESGSRSGSESGSDTTDGNASSNNESEQERELKSKKTSPKKPQGNSNNKKSTSTDQSDSSNETSDSENDSESDSDSSKASSSDQKSSNTLKRKRPSTKSDAEHPVSKRQSITNAASKTKSTRHEPSSSESDGDDIGSESESESESDNKSNSSESSDDEQPKRTVSSLKGSSDKKASGKLTAIQNDKRASKGRNNGKSESEGVSASESESSESEDNSNRDTSSEETDESEGENESEPDSSDDNKAFKKSKSKSKPSPPQTSTKIKSRQAPATRPEKKRVDSKPKQQTRSEKVETDSSTSSASESKSASESQSESESEPESDHKPTKKKSNYTTKHHNQRQKQSRSVSTSTSSRSSSSSAEVKSESGSENTTFKNKPGDKTERRSNRADDGSDESETETESDSSDDNSDSDRETGIKSKSKSKNTHQTKIKKYESNSEVESEL